MGIKQCSALQCDEEMCTILQKALVDDECLTRIINPPEKQQQPTLERLFLGKKSLEKKNFFLKNDGDKKDGDKKGGDKKEGDKKDDESGNAFEDVLKMCKEAQCGKHPPPDAQ